jgi:hypothetical protein
LEIQIGNHAQCQSMSSRRTRETVLLLREHFDAVSWGWRLLLDQRSCWMTYKGQAEKTYLPTLQQIMGSMVIDDIDPSINSTVIPASNVPRFLVVGEMDLCTKSCDDIQVKS